MKNSFLSTNNVTLITAIYLNLSYKDNLALNIKQGCWWTIKSLIIFISFDFYICYLICYLGEVACFETSSFRHTPIYFSSEKYFKYVLKISDSLFHQTSPRMKNVRPGVPMKSVCNFSLKSVLVTHLGVWLRKKLSVILLAWSKSVLVVITRDLMKQSSVYQELALVLEFCL